MPLAFAKVNALSFSYIANGGAGISRLVCAPRLLKLLLWL